MKSTKELQIGDWVEIKNHTTKVLELTSDGVVNEDVYIGEINPIPITVEILEANGFVRVGEVWNRLYRLEFSNDTTDYESFTVDYNFLNENLHIFNKLICTTMGISFYSPICKHIHELQHALRLCGIEKEIQI